MRRRLSVLFLVAIAGAAFYTSRVLATPASGFTAVTLARGLFGEIDARNLVPRDDHWQAQLMTQGMSDVYVQSNVWVPGGTTGWHTHPGHSLIIVTAGAVTVYDADDPSCTPQVYTQGMGFVDPGGHHAHVIRNEGTVEARTTAVQLVPAGATRRIDVPSPGNCAF